MAPMYGGVAERVSAQMTRAQAARLKCLAQEAYQPHQYAANLSFEEAAQRIEALRDEIALADSF